MKLNRTLVVMLAVVLLAICSKSTNSQQLQDREGLIYEVSNPDPYTGTVETFYENGQKQSGTSYVDGKEHGKYDRWYEHGQKMLEENYVDGKPHGKRIVWAENGKILAEVNYVDGVLVERKDGY